MVTEAVARDSAVVVREVAGGLTAAGAAVEVVEGLAASVVQSVAEALSALKLGVNEEVTAAAQAAASAGLLVALDVAP